MDGIVRTQPAPWKKVDRVLCYRRVNENGVSEPPIRQVCEHCRLHRGQDPASLGANHREAGNAVVAPTDKNLHEALCFVRRLCPVFVAAVSAD
jgi:hypothetical protein